MALEEDKPEYWRKELNSLQFALEGANENGLLKNDSQTYNKILTNVADALNDLSANPPKIVDARTKYSLACQELNQHTNTMSFEWRFKYSYGGPALIFLLGLFSALLLVWAIFQQTLLNLNIFWVPSWAFLWGSLGGVLHGFWWLWQHVSERAFRKVWYTWYIVLPIMGSILGAVTYLVFYAGFIASTGTTEFGSQPFVMLLSAIAGFSARWAVQVLGKITELIKIG